MESSIIGLLVGNWKMNGTSNSLPMLSSIAKGFQPYSESIQGVICVPATLIHRAVERVSGCALAIGGQDCSFYEKGAYTGDISSEMLYDSGARYVLIGHSERRVSYHETDEILSKKITQAWNSDLFVLLCVGETAAEKKEGKTLSVLEKTIQNSIPADMKPNHIAIAYEPIWAVNTECTPKREEIESAHKHIRLCLKEKMGEKTSTIPILYGGAVTPLNAGDIFSLEDVNGLLLGRASLEEKDFLQIVDACYRLQANKKNLDLSLKNKVIDPY